jgi:hypothetical protein
MAQEHMKNESEGGRRAAHFAQSRKRGGKCANGGELSSKTPEKADGNPAVIKEAEAGKSIGKIGGVKGKKRLDRKCGGRATGGGADTSPYSSAGASLRHKRGGACH